MKLVEAQVHTFKNILDSTPVQIEPAITCVVGKNESGKTAFLHSLYRADPAHQRAKFDVQQHYPAWLEKQHRREGRNLQQTQPIQVTFEMEPKDLSAIESQFGSGIITSKRVTYARDYGDQVSWLSCSIDESSAVRHILRDINVPADFAEANSKAATLKDIDVLIASLTKDAGESAKTASAAISAAKAKLLAGTIQIEKVGTVWRACICE